MFYTLQGAEASLLDLPAAKRQLRIDVIVTHEDDRITELIKEAQSLASHELGRQLGEQDLIIETNHFPVEIEDDFSPVQSITSIEYTDENGANSSLTIDDDFELVTVNRYDKKVLYKIDPLPTLANDAKAVKLTVKIGYTANNVPGFILSGLKLLLSYLFENRDDTVDMKRRASRNILRPFKKW